MGGGGETRIKAGERCVFYCSLFVLSSPAKKRCALRNDEEAENEGNVIKRKRRSGNETEMDAEGEGRGGEGTMRGRKKGGEQGQGQVGGARG